MSHKILIVEDEELIRFGLQENLEMENYIVETAEDGEMAIEKIDSFKPDLVLLDLMLPKKSGIEVCRVIRKKRPQTYIIMLTAKTDETSKVLGLEIGADDYVTKPFSLMELLARIKAFLRRAPETVSVAETSPEDDDIVEFADLRIDFKKFEATKNNEPLKLAAKEFEILKYFWQHRGEVIKRDDLLKNLWGYTSETMPTTRTIDNYIANLRKKIEVNSTTPKIITIPTVGYKFNV